MSDSIDTTNNKIITSIKVNPYTNDPDKAWVYLKKSIKKEKVEILPLNSHKPENKIRFVCISDTHSLAHSMQNEIPPGDILIHAGDFSMKGSTNEVKEFSQFLSTLDNKFTHKIVIAGNHDLSFDKKRKKIPKNIFNLMANQNGLDIDEINPKEHLKNCIYLEDSQIELFGFKIYGSPWQPTNRGWGFNADRGLDILEKWNQIPDDTEILITHGPPLGFGDIIEGGYHVGCCELLSTIRDRVRPKYHVFGHIHEDYGMWTDGVTNYINASTCNSDYVPLNPPIIFDIEKKILKTIKIYKF